MEASTETFYEETHLPVGGNVAALDPSVRQEWACALGIHRLCQLYPMSLNSCWPDRMMEKSVKSTIKKSAHVILQDVMYVPNQ